ncbi:MAG: succinate dehydrogenase [Proteobacteria bacterium]|nr:succinate dehydrogenase [Pseudomonadota bacterium]
MASSPETLPGGHIIGLGETRRKDNWWASPIMTVVYIGAALAYGTWAAFQGDHYQAGPYLTPLYSPTTLADPAAIGGAGGGYGHVWFGNFPSWWPSFIPASPALLILPLPGFLRLTCYYYRKAYYRSFMGTPPGCSVEGVLKGQYGGETKLFLWQNFHRYALYLALIYNVILFYDAGISFFYKGSFGVGVGSIILLVNASLLASYSFGCHSFRHLFGGRLDCFTCDSPSKAQHSTWKFATWFNERHMQVAWISLGFVMFTDIYIRSVSHGIIPDLNTWGANMSAAARPAAAALGL